MRPWPATAAGAWLIRAGMHACLAWRGSGGAGCSNGTEALARLCRPLPVSTPHLAFPCSFPRRVNSARLPRPHKAITTFKNTRTPRTSPASHHPDLDKSSRPPEVRHHGPRDPPRGKGFSSGSSGELFGAARPDEWRWAAARVATRRPLAMSSARVTGVPARMARATASPGLLCMPHAHHMRASWPSSSSSCPPATHRTRSDDSGNAHRLHRVRAPAPPPSTSAPYATLRNPAQPRPATPFERC
jgi:hypothetical protein